jgi:hypothetical protein
VWDDGVLAEALSTVIILKITVAWKDYMSSLLANLDPEWYRSDLINW